MLHRMSVFSSLAGSTMTDSWPMTRVMAGMSAVPVGHAIDLAFFFPTDERPRHDALIAETRRHLGGCLTAIEMALRVSLDHAPAIATALSPWPDPVCWRMLCDQPAMLSPALLAHMQMRAGVTLMLRQFGQPGADHITEEEGEPLLRADDPLIGNAVSALTLAEGRWIARGGEDQPMRPDLPAEHHAELVWTAAACLTSIARRGAGEAGDALLVAFERSGWALLADHDESVSPIAEAERLVRGMGAAADAPDLLGAALDQRRFLLFAALAARRLRMRAMQVIDILVMGPVAQIATLCRALGGADADYRHLLLSLRPIRPALSDLAIVKASAHYRDLPEMAADAAVSALRTPAPFRAKLDHLLQVTAR